MPQTASAHSPDDADAIDELIAPGGRAWIGYHDRGAEAGCTEEELDEIEELAASRAEGPRRETLLAAAELLRDRHRARKRGEDVPPLDA